MGRAKVDSRSGGKKAKDPNKPKRSTSAYFYYLAHCREEAKKHGKSLSKIAEFTKECSEKWRALDAKAKKEFDQKAATDKARYEREMANYSGGSRGGKAAKDPNAPKKPMTGYFLFLQDFREKHKGEDIANKDLLKMAGEEWREMDDSEKMPFEKRSQEGQKKYESAMAAYKKGTAANGAAAGGGDDDDEEEEDEVEDDEDCEEDDE